MFSCGAISENARKSIFCGGCILSNPTTEKVYPINTKIHKNAPQMPPEQQENVEPKKSSARTVIIEAVLAGVFIAIALTFSLLMVQKTAHKVGTAVIPAVTDQGISSDLMIPIEVSDIPKSYTLGLPLYDFARPVPESETVGFEYFKETVFIGDSRTQGLILHTPIDPIYDFSAQGATTLSIRTMPYISLVDGSERSSYTLTEALTMIEGNFKAVYVSAGVNELGWKPEIFVDSFRSLILAIREVTDVPVYIQLILPVTTDYAETSRFGVTNEKQAEFNKALVRLAEELSVFYLDPCPLCSLEDGSLDPAYSSFDGAHLSPEANNMIANYYRSHVVDINLYSNINTDN